MRESKTERMHNAVASIAKYSKRKDVIKEFGVQRNPKKKEPEQPRVVDRIRLDDQPRRVR
jgi:hypothetical protein